MMKRHFGITGKVVTAMSIVVLTITLLIATYTYKESKQLMQHQIDRELSIKIENVKNEVTSFFHQKGDIVQQLSIIPLVKKLAKDNKPLTVLHDSQEYEYLQQVLNETMKNNEHINLFWFINMQQNYYVANSDQVSDTTFTTTERPWFLKLERHQPGTNYSPPYIDFATKKSVVSITHPILFEEEVFGYMGVDVQIDELPLLLNDFEMNGHKVILTSNDNQVIYDRDNMWPIFEKVKLSENKVMRIDSSDVNDIYYADFRTVGDLGWKILIYVPEDTFLEPLAKYQTTLILFWIIALLILLTTLAWVLRYLLRDIPMITKQLKRIEEGDFNLRIHSKRKDEVGEISHAIDHMAEQIQEQINTMNYQAHFDSLTKLPNRNLIEKTLDEWLATAETHGKILGVAFLDLDHFKNVNDSKGHAYGDELLLQVGNRIQKRLPSNCFFGRFGGDEFILLLLANPNETSEIQDTLTLIHEAFHEGFTLFDHEIHITTSMGVALYPDDAKTKTALLANADTALYEAKEAGRNLIYFFNEEMKVNFEKSFMIQKGLRTALENNEFILHYQPQFDIHLGKITSVEALIRWEHPTYGMISPLDFIPEAEKSGQIIEIGDWVIESSLQAIKRIILKEPSIQRIAINVSAVQLREKNFVHKLEEALVKYDVPPSLLEIEVTESVIIVDEKDAFQKFRKLKALGIQIALDDFGTGYSSLNYLHILEINKVKIDRSFIQEIEDNSDVFSIMEKIIELAHMLGFEIVAEGVENEAQLKLITEMKVDVSQGFLHSRPLDEESLLHYLNPVQL